MDVLGLGVATIALFVGFGLFTGVLFGFFGMGGSFLVTPALLVVGYPVPVAVGSGLAFVFATSAIGTLRHRDYGQIDYRLAVVMIPGLTLGIEVGKRAVFSFDDAGAADLFVSAAYVALLGLVGVVTLWDAHRDSDGYDEVGFAARVAAIRLPPRITLAGDRTVSVWVILAVAGVIGTLSGFLGVGGGFLLLPAVIYGLGVPVPIAVGTSLSQITVSGAYGAFVYADAGAVALPTVGSLLAGSVFGVRIGAGATRLVDESELTGYFAVLLFAGSLSVATAALGDRLGIEALTVVSVVLVFGTPVLVGTAVVLTTVCRRRRGMPRDPCSIR
ncbi:sulfite exporter TauE/SafE family protein [Halomicrobium salinisoli]|uniref:sulfite exporter TauE/SafE family protein n=1 Tax=Halomicrobium salinisoli TaxID=2878391 RepID=UPI001CEFD414|nr:sulfite exporter TauE/SafE family protein [Halomicrobium salinisoli]